MSLQKVTYIDLVTIIGAQNLNDIQDAIIDLEEWQTEAGAAIPQILANIAPSFSNSTSYSAGDCVIVLNKLYQFTADHPAGDWTGTDATEVNVTSLLKEAADSLSGEVDDLKSALNADYDVSELDWAIGSLSPGYGTELSSNTRIRSPFIPVVEGTAIEVNGNANCLIVYSYDSNYGYLADSSWANRFVVPAGVAFSRILIRKSSGNPVINSDEIASQVARCSVTLQLSQDIYDVVPKKANEAITAISISPQTISVERGTIDGGVPYNSTKWVRSQALYATIGSTFAVAPAEFTIAGLTLYFYNDDGSYQGSTAINSVKLGKTYTFQSDTWFRLRASLDGKPDLSDADVEAFNGVFTLKTYRFSEIHEEILGLQTRQGRIDKTVDSYIPALRNGSVQNAGNTYMVTLNEVAPVPSTKRLRLEYRGEFDAGYYLKLQLRFYTADAEGLAPTAASAYGGNVAEFTLPANIRDYDMSPYLKGRDSSVVFFAAAVAVYKPDGTAITLRATTHPDVLRFQTLYDDSEWDNRNANTADVLHLLKNARQIQNNAVNPITILHFSDIHGDSAVIERIKQDASQQFASRIDCQICTGDMVPSEFTSIASWWNPEVMTCIGNHDSAQIVDGVYNWTAKSMAECAENYIAPFVSGWGVQHISGNTYYYKDFADSAVRLIVLDGMLYIGSDTTNANAQTAWLSNLLDDAITNSKHVLIAIHAPHGGATPIPCSFTKLGESTMPSMADANTPQSIIGLVATKITGGLNFIGYICGHTHKDDIWDAAGDGTQLMFAVTCANSHFGSWKISDQNRDAYQDAYNLVTIDTASSTVKIVRGGGANVDWFCRPRKAISFDYSTGQKIAEIL